MGLATRREFARLPKVAVNVGDDTMSKERNKSRNSGRLLRCESLEPRQLLSVNGGVELSAASNEFPPVVQAPAVVETAVESLLSNRDQRLAISAIHFRIDGRELTLTSLDQPLQMEVGSTLEVIGIEYRLQGEESVSGKIAFEGYLNKLRGSRVRTDYSDGRFGGHVQQGELPQGAAQHPGLDGAWQVEAGSESLTLVMVRYGADEVVVEDRVTVLTQVGTPDFVFSPEIDVQGSSKGLLVGRQVRLTGVWGNQGAGTYRNYAEVNIYHESDPNKIVWAGTISDVVEAGESSKGRFRNKTPRDGFSSNWIPELGGSYTLKFYADPENTWVESDESNNVVTVELEVQDPRLASRGRDASGSFGFNHHSVQDHAAREAALAALASELNTTPVAQPTTTVVEVQADEAVEEVPAAEAFTTNTQLSNQAVSSSDPNTLEREPRTEDKWEATFDEALTQIQL